MTCFVEDIASRGYVVAAIDHPYMGQVALPDGTVTEPSEKHFKTPKEVYEYYAEDARFCVRQIGDLNATNRRFKGHLDVARMAAIGHSSGFIPAREICRTESSIKACVNLDAPGTPAEWLLGLNQALLWVRLERAQAPPGKFLDSLKNPVYEVLIESAGHGSVLDSDYVTATTPAQRNAAEQRLHIIEEYVAAFLDKHVKGKNADLSKTPNHDGPRVLLRTHLKKDR